MSVPADRWSRRGVIQALSLAGLGVAGEAHARPGGAVQVPGFDPRRWWQGDYRIVQTNLREIDVREDPRAIARAVRAFGGNTIVSNIGGIVGFYPTALRYQRRNPYLRGDFVRAMIDAARAEGLAYVGRFDLSKAMKPAYDANPGWFMRNRDGTPRTFAGTYQACPNGGWARDYGLQLLSEGLTRYRPDGLFFNMTGYPRTDYANVDHGICVCDNCASAFRAMYGRALPAREGFVDPAWPDYLDFQARTSEDLRQRIVAHVARLAPGVPIAQHDSVEQVGRGEVQRRVDRAAPEWAHQSGEQCRAALARAPGTPWSSTSTAHVDYPWRQVTESAAYHANRLAQAIGLGAKLDLYLMGTLADQDDPGYLPPVSAVFHWRAAQSAHYAGMAADARVGLYQSGATARRAGMTPHAARQTDEFRGLYSALVDSRVPFRLVSDARVADGGDDLTGYDVILCPNVMLLSDAEARALDGFVARGGTLIATGLLGGYDERGRVRAAVPLTAFPLARYGAPRAAEGWTLDPALGTIRVAGRVPLDGDYVGGTSRPGAAALMRFAPDQRYGPPEFSYAVPGDPARQDPGVAALVHGRGEVIHVPWWIGWHYHRDGLAAHRELIAALVARGQPAPRYVLAGDGPVELMTLARDDGAALITVVNYAGQRDTRYVDPPALHGLRLGVRGAPRGARALVAGQAITGERHGDLSWFALPPVRAFEAVLLTA